MYGHGRPINASHRTQVSPILLRLLGCALALLIICAADVFLIAQTATPSSSFDEDAATPTSCRFRISWGGGQNAAWQGSVQSDSASLSRVTPLGLSRDSSVTALLVDATTIGIGQRSAVNYDGFDFTVTGSPESMLQITMASQATNAAQWQRTMTLAELLTTPLNEPLDAFQHGITVTRVPGDEIRFEFDRENLVLSPGEKLKTRLSLNHTSIRSSSAQCRVMLVPARESSPVMWSQTTRISADMMGNSAPFSMELTAPAEEGVYDWVIEFEKEKSNSRFSTNLLKNGTQLVSHSSKRTKVTRRVQFVVVDSARPSTDEQKRYEPVLKLTPEQIVKSAARWLPGVKSSQKVLGSDPATLVLDQQRSWLKLSTGQWQAIPMTIPQPGKPHNIEIEYAPDQPMALGLSVLDFDANGQVPIQGADSGIYVPESTFDGVHGDSAKHRMTFWPRSRACYLLVANQSSKHISKIGSIELSVAVDSQPDEHQPSTQPQPPRQAQPPNRRQRLAFCGSANFPQGLNVEKFFDTSVGQPLDDWQVFYEGADRLVDYLKQHHYHGAVISVVADGGAIYPSALLQSTPKNDSGIFESLGQDPVRKDVLALLLEVFKRADLVLIPELEFTAPIVEIERSRLTSASPPADQSFDLIDFSGQRVPALDDSIPVYNPLSPRVQQHALDVITELLQRYSNQPALGGVAVVCRPESWTLLPGRQGGYDRTTLERFYQTLPQSPSVPAAYEVIQEQLFGEYSEQWVQWRADQMSALYAQMAKAVRDALPEGQLLLAPLSLERNEEIHSTLSPSLHASVNVEQLMLRMGFDQERLFQEPAIVLLKPEITTSTASLAATRVPQNMQQQPGFQTFFAGGEETGMLNWNEGSWAHFAQLQSLGPFAKQSGRLLRHHQLVPAGHWGRAALASALFQQDSLWLVDGGNSLVMGQDNALEDFTNVFSKLPRRRFNSVPCTAYPITDPTAKSLRNTTNENTAQGCPIAVRTLDWDGNTWLYGVNDSPWPTEVKVFLNHDSQPTNNKLIRASSTVNLLGKFTSFSNLPIIEGRSNSGHPFISVTLPAYGIFGGQFINQNTSPSHFEISVADTVHDTLRKKIYQLQAKLNLATQTQPMQVLENNEFETQSESTQAGWDFGDQPSERVSIDSDTGYQSASALHMSSSGQSVWTRSNRFAPPQTGRVSITVWIKSLTEQQPPLRLAIEGQTRSSTYYRFGAIGALASNGNINQIDQQWRRFAVHFDDLPDEELIDLRVGFDLMGKGEVLIDRVHVYDRWFDEKDAKAMTQLLASAVPLLSNSHTYESCRRIVDGYWGRFLDQHIEHPNSHTSDTPTSATEAATSEEAATNRPAVDSDQASDETSVPLDIAPTHDSHSIPAASAPPKTGAASSLLRRWKKNFQLRK